MPLNVLLLFLVVYPAIAAGLLLLVRSDSFRGVFVSVSAALVAAGSIAVAVLFALGGGKPVALSFECEAIDVVLALVDAFIAISIAVIAGRGRKPWIVLLAIIQLALLAVNELAVAPRASVFTPIYVDTLSVIMALVIGIIGTGITVYAIGYMRDFQRHADSDRRHVFFAVMWIFLTGMYLIVFSNNLAWLFCGWEITTVCSFLLIGYTRTEEATRNAFRQIWMNLLGGLAFACANIVSGLFGIGELTQLIALGQLSPTVVTTFVVTLLGFAAITKAAQMPFHTWLLGAMVAPTPTSALLHSSTMVKAGCFLLIKLAPACGLNIPGIMLMLVGGFTFMMASIVAITQSNAKRVLAYSTIANLGLIVACAGIGSPLATWAAIFLLIFHAAAKSLLFLCVGTAEHHIGSRNIEDMDSLFSRMPRLSRFMVIGMLIMFIAPFGMLISKWAAFQAFIDSYNIGLVLMLAFGSAATFFFWAKWIGKVSASARSEVSVEQGVHASEWLAITLMAVLAIACTLLFPLISYFVVDPYLGVSTGVGLDNLWLLSALALVVVAVMVGISGRPSGKGRTLPVYLSGVSLDGDDRVFSDSMQQPLEATQRNWYMEGVFSEEKLRRVGQVVGTFILLWGVVAALTFMMGIGGGL